MYAQQQALDVIANNLANVNSTGFKADRLTFREALAKESFSPGEAKPRLLGTLGCGALVEGTTSSLEQGPMVQTGGALDVAIEGDGYFSVKTAAGTRYTRAGSFQLDATGKVVTKNGDPVLGARGEITVPSNAKVEIDEKGNVTADGSTVDTLAMVTGNLSKQGNGLYSGTAKPAIDTKVTSGYIEGSTVNAVQEMVAMIETMRVFEANQKVLQAHDETLSKAVNDLARMS
jgi:flagellar basal-body rod protein FlgF